MESGWRGDGEEEKMVWLTGKSSTVGNSGHVGLYNPKSTRAIWMRYMGLMLQNKSSNEMVGNKVHGQVYLFLGVLSLLQMLSEYGVFAADMSYGKNNLVSEY